MIILLLIVFFANLQAVTQEQMERFHIVTVTNTLDHEGFHKLERSCEVNQINLEVLGVDLPYEGNGTKLIHMTNYLTDLKDDEIVLLDEWITFKFE